MANNSDITSFDQARKVGAIVVALFLIAELWPSTAAIMDAHGSPRFWQLGPFAILPAQFLGITSLLMLATGCVLLGLRRRWWIEVAGWLLFGWLLFITFSR